MSTGPDNSWLVFRREKTSTEQSFPYFFVTAGYPYQTSLLKQEVMNLRGNLVLEELLLERMVEKGDLPPKEEETYKTPKERPVMWRINLVWEYICPFPYCFSCLEKFNEWVQKTCKFRNQFPSLFVLKDFFPLQKITDSEQVTHCF